MIFKSVIAKECLQYIISSKHRSIIPERLWILDSTKSLPRTQGNDDRSIPLCPWLYPCPQLKVVEALSGRDFQKRIAAST
mmetsp:Transcript_26498/g.47885  ORF Transcript_26498/g.47885 Transcript_26498/m.47885 type:complete len:80 (-) Transcript_26498:2913-3152(-)